VSPAQKVTAGFVIATVAIWVLYDGTIAAKYGSSATISWVVYIECQKRPAIPFAAGVLCGHLFFQFAGMVAAPAMRALRRLIYVGGDRSNDFTERRL
jgi:hypothetical protein